MNYNPLDYRYPSQRTVVYGTKGMVATSQPLAAQAGLDILKRGGNAVDAAIATAACLTVVEPTSNGIGGDAFAIVWMNNKLYGLNASGGAPQGISIDILKNKGINEIPKFGWTPVTVPGVPAAWGALSEAFGKLPLKEVLTPAITYAYEGYPVSPITGQYWCRAFEIYEKNLKGEEFTEWFKVFAPLGRAPKIGELWRSNGHGKTLEAIAETGGRDFYSGDLAQRIHNYSKSTGGYIEKSDLEAFKVQWVDPVKVNYRGYDVWELPPNGQGIVALMALNILKGFEFKDKESVDTYHKQIEAIKLAFADGQKYITDPKKMKVRVDDLLSDAYGEERRKLIGENAALPEAGEPARGGTVYLATADGEGNMVSYIQSNYMGFGSGVVIPETGISLQNRGHNFSLNPLDHNCLEPGKRTYHTIIPGFLTKDQHAVGPFGVMGGFMQPQGHLQIIMNTIDFNMNPQTALDASRWCWTKEKSVEMENLISEDIFKSLQQKGHNLVRSQDVGILGRGQIIWRNSDGILAGGTEGRTDGAVATW
ncbi:gamma-glutamyltransferase [Alkaliphilus peptidifermentans]|uniref:Glutathione hydrolase proenzyme n=1 Tax=Alkaliphilus peptidifermentans DSM 18978 TaxID=1120976 RepID=A0A1G5K8V4_9FIRM|nr:gamma-glutamyltransferase [Alkaliphilus peptidifermentans]SCY97076.1 gamma-glutamyltranspeptidase / glutathione hydrolase [Alkaliphilus peptidifermentans DSM 18978]